MKMKFYSPLTAEFFPDEPNWEDESYNEYEGCPLDGHDLLQYAAIIDGTVKIDMDDFNGDLMQFYHADDAVRRKVIRATPSVEIHGNKLCGCMTVELCEALTPNEQKKLEDYISGQYSDGWGESFEQRDICVEDGALAVHFWQDNDFAITATIDKTPDIQVPEPEPKPLRPKMNLIGADGNIFAIMGRASRLLKDTGQWNKANEMCERVMASKSYNAALAIVSEYVETELTPQTRNKPNRGDAR